ncbi:MAG: helix-turn-helix domain-containing protein [Candidatus Thiodiazotropha sp. (ex Lucinoma borealis)]|nr:helix-turn-helix domain-containing protein [Candidatus Thiodiazotropha sp. (ex Lucinoma borealis)]MCU7865534.1 helix-turn-helix domain-containing protein [Candidatus Thiodiazotropha sp. (ex Lucinoma borealis)]
MPEGEEITRGIVGNLSLHAIAEQLGRSPLTISREINRNGGVANYRASLADKAAWDRPLQNPNSAWVLMASYWAILLPAWSSLVHNRPRCQGILGCSRVGRWDEPITLAF